MTVEGRCFVACYFVENKFLGGLNVGDYSCRIQLDSYIDYY